MQIITNPAKNEWRSLSKRAFDSDISARKVASEILMKVKDGGDNAIATITEDIDGYKFIIKPRDSATRNKTKEALSSPFKVTKSEFDKSETEVDDTLKSAIKQAASNIRKFHLVQKNQDIDIDIIKGIRCIQKSVPISNIGLYIPGGNAPLFSTVLMLAIPAKIAGCKNIIMCTPTGKNGKVSPLIIWTAKYCGIENIYKIGGAQAIAAMAYGTESIPKVDKIFGPGNKYVTAAKQLVGNTIVAIDMPAGPSEVMILADERANAKFIAADLLSQAEHGADSQAILVCNNTSLAAEVLYEIDAQQRLLSRNNIINKALQNGKCIIFNNDENIIDFANEYAPEHLIISMSDPWKTADKITSAGSIFIGNFSPESAGDYASGTNHTLPTSGWAHSFSGVNTDSFMHKITYQELTYEGLASLSETIIAMAEAEGLSAHSNAIKIRLKRNKDSQ